MRRREFTKLKRLRDVPVLTYFEQEGLQGVFLFDFHELESHLFKRSLRLRIEFGGLLVPITSIRIGNFPPPSTMTTRLYELVFAEAMVRLLQENLGSLTGVASAVLQRQVELFLFHVNLVLKKVIAKLLPH